MLVRMKQKNWGSAKNWKFLATSLHRRAPRMGHPTISPSSHAGQPVVPQHATGCHSPLAALEGRLSRISFR